MRRTDRNNDGGRTVLLFMGPLTDEELAQRTQAGDAGAFGVLVDRYTDRLVRYGRRFLLDIPEAEDVAQDVFLKVYRNIRSFDPTRRFSPWVYRIAHNELVNYLKSRKHEAIPFFDPDTLFPHPVSPETAEGPAERAEMRHMLDACLAKLEVKYREVLALYYDEELGYREIADILKIPTSTVGVRLRRAREKVRTVWQTTHPIPRTE